MLDGMSITLEKGVQLKFPSSDEIYAIADRAEQSICTSNSRRADQLAIENAIRSALMLMLKDAKFTVG